jgi:hypothetical protein
MLRSALTTLAAAALYGYALGAAHSELYATRNLIKFPLLIVITAGVCALSYFVVARSLLVPLSFGGVQRATWRLFHDTSILLASVAPATFFIARVLRATDDGRMGDYHGYLAFNFVAIGLAGTIALIRQALGLLREHPIMRVRATALVALWLTLTLAVGGQAAFVMRPFFGIPATRGFTPPFFLGDAPDVRGATNFFEALRLALEHPLHPPNSPDKR